MNQLSISCLFTPFRIRRYRYGFLLAISIVFVCSINAFAQNIWPSEYNNYTHRQKIKIFTAPIESTVENNEETTNSTNPIVPIRISPLSFPIENGTWTVNEQTYQHRLKFRVEEQGGRAVVDHVSRLQLNTKWLADNDYLPENTDGDEFEFTEADGITPLSYWIDSSKVYTKDAHFFVKLNLAIGEKTSLYFYFDPTVNTISSSFATLEPPQRMLVVGPQQIAFLPDDSELPLIVQPRLFDADIVLNGQSLSWPYDIGFADFDGKVLDFSVPQEEERTLLNAAMTFDVKLNESIGDTTEIFVYFGDSTKTTDDWNATNTFANTFDYHQSFDGVSTANWTNHGTGNWSIEAQQKPIFKGNDNAWTRHAQIIKKDSLYYLLHIGSKGVLNLWSLPWDIYASTSKDLIHWTNHYDVLRDNSDWVNTHTSIPGTTVINNIIEKDGIYYMGYHTPGHEVNAFGLATSTDLLNWTKFGGNPVYGNYVDSLEHFESNLVFDESTETWYWFWQHNKTEVHYAYIQGATPLGDFVYGGLAADLGKNYLENVDIHKEGNKWYLFYTTLEASTEGEGFMQRIGVAETTVDNFPMGWTDNGNITMPIYEFNKSITGPSRMWKEGNTWHMVYSGQSLTEGGISISTGNRDNPIAYATSPVGFGFPMVWTPQNVDQMYHLQDDVPAGAIHFNTAVLDENSEQTYSNASITTDVILSLDQTMAGLLFRYQDAQNYYTAVLDRANSTIKLGKSVNGTFEWLQTEDLNFDMMDGGYVHRIRVETFGGQIKVWYNQHGDEWVEAIQTNDDVLLNAGKVGLIGINADVWFDNFTVQSIPHNASEKLIVESEDIEITCQYAENAIDEIDIEIYENCIENRANLQLRVYLQGALDNGPNPDQMRTDLLEKNLLPLVSPYTELTQFEMHNENIEEETTTQAILNQNDIVDWVLIELRDKDNPAQIVATTAALLQKDGTVLDTQGNPQIVFDVDIENAYVAIRHRNHLGAMTAQAQPLTSNLYIDFTNTNTQYWGENACIELNSGKLALWAGNCNVDNKLLFQGLENDANQVFFSVVQDPNNSDSFINYSTESYSLSDVNLDGKIIYQGFENDINILFFNIISVPSNQVGASNFVLEEQLP